MFSSLTGCRVGEICSFKWSDVDYENEELHIHTQQLSKMVDGHYVYYEVPYARNVLNHMSRAAKDNNLTLLNTCRVNYTEK